MGTRTGTRTVMNVGVFGGTFDPPHLGHLMVANELVYQLELDRLLIIPASIPPHKRDRDVTPGAIRLEMVNAVFGGEPGWEVSEMELDRAGSSYTVDTLRALKDERPDAELLLALGADQVAELDTWREPDEVLRLAALVGFARSGQEVPPVRGRPVRRVDVPHLEISSTEIRRRVAAREPFRYMVPPAVAAIIDREGLYTVARL